MHHPVAQFFFFNNIFSLFLFISFISSRIHVNSSFQSLILPHFPSVPPSCSYATVTSHRTLLRVSIWIWIRSHIIIFVLLFPCTCNHSHTHRHAHMLPQYFRSQGFTRQIHATGLHDLNVTAVSFSRRQHTFTKRHTDTRTLGMFTHKTALFSPILKKKKSDVPS